MGVDFADRYSLLHFAVGVVAYFVGIPFWGWGFLNVLFEAVENSEWGVYFISTHLSWWPGGKRAPDTILNSLGDIIFGMLGWALGWGLAALL